MVFALAGVGVAALKGFLYAHILNEVEYAVVGYYLLWVGVGGLIVGSGVMLRAHTELPAMDKAQRSAFIAQGRGVGFIFWLALSIPLSVISFLGGGISLPLLTLLQVLIMFLFTLDVVALKSDGNFVGYARSVFFRNLLLMVGGLVVAYVTGSAQLSVLAETLCGVLACGRVVTNWLCNFKFPSGVYLRQSLKFLPISLLGGVGQYVDRLCASVFLSLGAFSEYSYLSLLMFGGLAIQQIINTKVITLLSVRCRVSPHQTFLYLLKVSASVFACAFVLLLCSAYILFFSVFAASWVGLSPLLIVIFVVGVCFKAAEFFSSFLVVLHRKKLLLAVQLVGVFFYSLLALFSYSAGFDVFVSSMVLGMGVYTLSLMFISWRVSLAQASC